MNKEKLDKIVDEIILEMGDLQLTKQTISYLIRNEYKELVALLVGADFVLTGDVPLIDLLYRSVDPKSFSHVMNRVGNHLSSVLDGNPRVVYDAKFDEYYYFTISY